jgi:hypothetical protein
MLPRVRLGCCLTLGAHTSYSPLMSFTKAAARGLLVVLMVLSGPRPLAAAPVPVRFVEGAVHGFLALRTLNGVLVAPGELLQGVRGGEVESRMVFRFKDGSVLDETVVFTQQRVLTLQSYRLVQRGPAFPEDTEIALERATGQYRVKTTAGTEGREEVLDGTLELPPDVYNGLVLTVAKNLPPGASETVHYVAFTPTPRLIQLELAPAGEHKVLVGEVAKTAIRSVVKPRLVGPMFVVPDAEQRIEHRLRVGDEPGDLITVLSHIVSRGARRPGVVPKVARRGLRLGKGLPARHTAQLVGHCLLSYGGGATTPRPWLWVRPPPQRPAGWGAPRRRGMSPPRWASASRAISAPLRGAGPAERRAGGPHEGKGTCWSGCGPGRWVGHDREQVSSSRGGLLQLGLR